MQNTDWLIVDTETDGLRDPIHVVEIAAQRMHGWEPVGDKFRVLLNHGVPIPSAAVAIHGYTAEFLAKHGESPLEAHAKFRSFAEDLPVVCHNLAFDWSRALYPECLRLGLPPAGRKGFCSLMLSRRVIHEATRHSMDALRQTFSITTDHAHRASGDVDSLVSLFCGVFRPRLEAIGLTTLTQVCAFASRTPVAKCLAEVRSQSSNATRSAPTLDNWFFLDPKHTAHGPLSARHVLELMGSTPCWVWKEGLSDWESSQTCSEFIKALAVPGPSPKKVRRKTAKVNSLTALLDVCRAILADGILTTEEVVYLSKWIENSACTSGWPATEIAQTVERILADGSVTDEERAELQGLLKSIDQAYEDVGQGESRISRIRNVSTLKSSRGRRARSAEQIGEPTALPSSQVDAFASALPSRLTPAPFTLVKLVQGSPAWLAWRTEGIGASDAPVIMGENPWKSRNTLLREKCGRSQSEPPNRAMLLGISLEPKAREAYIVRTSQMVQPACLQSNAYAWLRASVVGISPSLDRIVEIKCGRSAYEQVADLGCIPDYYYGQLQHIMAVTGLATIDFWCYLPGMPEHLLTIQRNEHYISRLLDEEKDFWNSVLQMREEHAPRPSSSTPFGI